MKPTSVALRSSSAKRLHSAVGEDFFEGVTFVDGVRARDRDGDRSLTAWTRSHVLGEHAEYQLLIILGHVPGVSAAEAPRLLSARRRRA